LSENASFLCFALLAVWFWHIRLTLSGMLIIGPQPFRLMSPLGRRLAPDAQKF
jgi:hypothetical protein